MSLDLDFRFKPFNEMTDADYARIGFKSGLEIHQQLLTQKKLFCRCPAGKYSDVFHAEILRHMRPTLSELGEYDGTALMEFKTHKNIIYHINRETVCTYEMDDTPPFELNEEALEIALEIALLYKCAMVDEIHIARKQYLDGSIPTGFQRTTIAGVDGWIPYKNRKINIIQLGLEEDACREKSDIGHVRTYITDRLGMPLIETVTGPEMITPVEVMEVGEILRRLTRSTGHVRTGIGAARQDVNVSVTGGTRIEIKGVPRLPMIPLLTYNEAMRQYNLLRLRAELATRGVTPETFTSRTDDVTKLLRKTRYEPIRLAVAEGLKVSCVTLPNFKGLLHWQTQTDTFFSREISDRVRVIACLTRLPNIIHSDSHTETLATSEWLSLRKAVGAGENDTMIVVWGDERDTATGSREIVIRAKEATEGIPSETRQALEDGTNGFERILPGPNRMYPDTDLPPKRVTAERLAKIQAGLPEPYWEREAWYTKLGVPVDCVRPLAISLYAPLFKEAVKKWKVSPKFAAVALIQFPKRLKHKGFKSAISMGDMEAIFEAFHKGSVTQEGILPLMAEVSRRGGFDQSLLPLPITAEAATEMAYNASDEAITLSEIPGPRRRIAMRIAMASLRGRFPGIKLAKMIEARLQGIH